MSTQSLSRITMETMANYRTAAAQVVAASGAGTRRLVRAVDGTLQTQVLKRASKVVPQAGERMDDLRGSVSRYVEQGIAQFERAAETTIERSNDFAMAQVTRLADMASELSLPIVTEGLQTAARLSLPAAQLALKVSSKVAEGTTTLADAAGAHPVAKVVRQTVRRTRRAAAPKDLQAMQKAVSKTVSKASARAGKQVKVASSKVKAQVKAQVKAPTRRTRKAI